MSTQTKANTAAHAESNEPRKSQKLHDSTAKEAPLAALVQDVNDTGLNLVAEDGRYVLYVGAHCPFAARPWVVVKFYGMEKTIRVVRLFPGYSLEGFFFEPQSDWEKEVVENYPDAGVDQEPLFGAKRIKEVYKKLNPDSSDAFTVPLLVDTQTLSIVSNDSMAMAKALCAVKAMRTRNEDIELLPSEDDDIRGHNQLLDDIHNSITRGPYKVIGGPNKQAEHEKACNAIFDSFDKFEGTLASSSEDQSLRFLMGQLRLADIFLFNTAVRWDLGYRWRFNIGGDSIMGDGYGSRYPNIASLVHRILAMQYIAGKEGAVDIADARIGFYSSEKFVSTVASRSFCNPVPPSRGWLPVQTPSHAA